MPAAQGQAQAAVTRQVTGTGQYQVTQACQAHQGFGAPANGRGQAQHFIEAAGDQPGTGVEPQLHAVGDAGGHRQHVLHGATQFRTQHVVAGIRAEGRAVQHVGDLLGELHIIAMYGHGRGQAEGDFFGEGRAGDHGQRYGRAKDVFGHFMQETSRTRLEALGGPGYASRSGPQRRQLAQGFSEGVRRHDHQHQVGILQGGGKVGGGAQVVRQRNAGQVAGVFVLLVNGGGDLRVATPQRDCMAVAGHQRGQCGAPGASTEYRDIQGIRHPSSP